MSNASIDGNRVLRITTARGEGCASKSIASITSPELLAHALMSLDQRVESGDYTKYLRASGLASCCVREHLLGFRNNLKFTKREAFADRLTFDIGHGVHEYLQNSPTYFRDSRRAWWRCTACGRKVFGRFPLQRCSCGALSDAFRHHEHEVKMDGPYYLTGHVDMFVEVSPADVRVLDIKTINGEEFAKLTKPKGEHVFQVMTYMAMMRYETRLPIKVSHTDGILFYVSKKAAGRGQLPVKAFHVPRRKEVMAAINAKLQEHALGIEDESFLPAPLVDCAGVNWTSYRAKMCPAKEICMALAA